MKNFFILTSSSSLKQKKSLSSPLSEEDGNRFFTLQNWFFSLALCWAKKNILNCKEDEEEGKKVVWSENLINKTFSWNFPIFHIYFLSVDHSVLLLPFFLEIYSHTRSAFGCFDSSPNAATNSRVKICVFRNYWLSNLSFFSAANFVLATWRAAVEGSF